MTTTALPVERDRAYEDMLLAERRLRSASEQVARDLHQVLLELAIRFNGIHLEELRRTNPAVPAHWSSTDWKDFFAGVEQVVKTPGWGQDQQREEELAKQITMLQRRIVELESQSVEPIVAPVQTSSPPAEITIPISVPSDQELTASTSALFLDLQTIQPSFPKTCPSEFRRRLDGNGRTGVDLTKAYQRYWIALYLIGRWRISSMFEIDDIQARLAGLSASSGSLRRILDNLLESNFLISEKLSLSSPRSSLKIIRLTPDGGRLFKILFGLDPQENNWERLIRLHEGDRFPNHTLAVLIFALHARKRGWATQVLPPVESPAAPDLLVQRGDQKYFVEVELGQREKPNKWRNLAELNDGKISLCAATPETRKRLVGDCRLDKLNGIATDLETLVKTKFQTISEETPLWLEEW